MTTFYAQPYDISASGFYFETMADYTEKSGKLRNDHGQPVEEYELQFIDGELIDVELCAAIGINQANIGDVIEGIDNWSDDDKRQIILAVGDGYSFDPKTDDAAGFDVTIYELDSMRELAEQFIEEGLFGEIPENLAPYIDYDAIARDLEFDYTLTTVAGQRLIYRIC
ncbi:MAG: antirestriction protein ArdA [Xanthobacteraceae bacterium]|nr:antirestriction protein ArdA [Xanthobacteraceae bacterium]